MLQKLAELLANVFVNISCFCLSGGKHFVYAYSNPKRSKLKCTCNAWEISDFEFTETYTHANIVYVFEAL
jgi:hypothetical protein